MPNTNRKADAFILLELDALGNRTMATAYLRAHTDPDVQHRSFSCLVNDASLMRRLPEWLAELRAEARLGRPETLAEQQSRVAGYSSSGSAATEITSLNSTCTSLGPATGPRSLIR